MKETIRWLLKAFAAGCIALALLCGFCFFWYNVPVHHDNPTDATDYVWEADTFYSKGTEGFAMGRTNNEGFNNLKDYTEGEKVDILLMGSSHMEAFNVAQDENAAAVLNQLFDGEKYCYNIGTAGHTMLYCIKNLGAALDRYQPGGYVVIETFSVDFSPSDLAAVAEGRLTDIESHSGGIIGFLQKLPYLRLFYTQHFKGGGEAFGDTQAVPVTEESSAADYAAQLAPVLEIVSAECMAHDVTPIIVYNSSLLISEDGSVYTSTDEAKLQTFAAVCRDKGIEFIDLCPTFIEEYEQSYQLPYGFSNTSPGAGHMNMLGHRLFAEEVYKAIAEMEG